MENEELKHMLWTSVLFYKSPDVELTACVMLSTKAVYFILDDVASTLSDQACEWLHVYPVVYIYLLLLYFWSLGNVAK